MNKNFTFYCLALIICLGYGCEEKLDSETQKKVDHINEKSHLLDIRRRISIMEDDFIHGDTTYKIRGYFLDGALKKIVSITFNTSFERDDYFYFNEHNKLMFSGHLTNYKGRHDAEEFKFYYDDSELIGAFKWQDHYDPHKPFPHEHFSVFHPNKDSLEQVENERLNFFKDKIYSEGFLLKREKPNTSL